MTKDLKETQKRWDTFAAAALTGLLANGNGAASLTGLLASGKSVTAAQMETYSVRRAWNVKIAKELADAMMFDFEPSEGWD